MRKLIRVTTVPLSMRTLLKGQLKYMKSYYEVVAITSGGDCFDQMLAEQGNIRGIKVEMSRRNQQSGQTGGRAQSLDRRGFYQ